jgi:hypothetical protein
VAPSVRIAAKKNNHSRGHYATDGLPRRETIVNFAVSTRAITAS